MFSNADEVLGYIKDKDVQFVDVRFCDLPGVMQHFNVPAVRRTPILHRRDVRRFVHPRLPGDPRVRHEADPRPDDRVPGPVPRGEDARDELLILDPFTDEPYSRDPRNIAAKAEAYLEGTGIADTVVLRPGGGVLRLRRRPFRDQANAGYYYIDSIEGAWNSGRVEEGGNRGYKTRYKGGYFPVPPVDHYADLRDQMSRRWARRHRGGARAPRGRHRRPGRDQLQVRLACCTRPTS